LAGFYCAEARLAIEIDCDAHAAAEQATYDSAYTARREERRRGPGKSSTHRGTANDMEMRHVGKKRANSFEL
jgi:hypothetical protein